MSHYPTFNKAWVATLSELSHAPTCSPRGYSCNELIAHTVSFPMCASILSIPERNISYGFMFAEAWWILTGQNRLEMLERYAPSYAKFSDDGLRLSGAYGPKIIDQLSYVTDVLKRDPHSRQAVINIWRERPGTSKDIPCTLSIQFLIRAGELHAVVNMRSNDVWLGMPYDVFSITMVAMMVLLELRQGRIPLKANLGNIYHTAASRHLYARDSEKAKAILNTQYFSVEPNPVLIDDRALEKIRPNSHALERLLYERITTPRIIEQDALVQKFAPWIMYGITDTCTKAD